MWFQHDGTSDHSSRQDWEHLTATYNDCWIGWDRTVAWPPRSPDLTPPVFFLCGYMKPWHAHRWIGWGRTVSWPPRSPDITPPVFFICGYMEPLYAHLQLILKRILLPVSLTQQQPSGRVMAFLHANENICYLCRKARHSGCVTTAITFWYNFCSEFFNT
jgi:hypothetical protein